MTRYMPVRAGTYQTSSKFGPRGGGMHWGLDFAAPDGTKIYAAQAGSVVHIGAADGFGQWIVIDHPGEAGSGTTVYGHMWDAHATGLRQGDQVNAGQHIAFVGNNGDSSGSIPRCGHHAASMTPNRGSWVRWNPEQRSSMANRNQKRHASRRRTTTCWSRSTAC